MRLRNIKGSKEFITACPYVIQNPEDYKGKWNTLFQNNHPIHIEVGMGKGKFLMELALLHPEINYIGIEMYSSVLYRALEKREEIECNNIYFLRINAEVLPELFSPGEVERIYLNFSDPWPKERHVKRRLTSSPFLHRYHQILSANGTLIFKTDNRPLFDFSTETITEEDSWTLEQVSYDLHQEPTDILGENVMTEYEIKFSSQGMPIHRLIAHPC